MLRPIHIIIAILIILTLACELPATQPVSTPLSTKISAGYIVTVGPWATATPTPFQPLNPNITASPTDAEIHPSRTPTLEDTTTPTITLTPTPDRPAKPEGQVNILLLGSDYRPNSGYRTDVIILVSLNPKQGTVSAVSFPRDLYLDIPGYGPERINTTMEFGGFPMTQATFDKYFKVKPDYYIMTNFAGFKSIINSLGGITVHAASNLTDRCDLPQSVNSYCSVGPGAVQMDGDLALWYVRSRYSSSDFDRERRSQEVIQAIFIKLISLDAISRAPTLFEEFISTVETNLTVGAILPLLPLASTIADGSHIRRYTIGPAQVIPYVTGGGAQVLLPKEDAIWQIIKEAIFAP
jgi:polyisoprenyl-teichoic acid--peptidoglycan teichoic acid transferase